MDELSAPDGGFDRGFVEVFDDQFPRLHRYLVRLTDDPDLAADLAQEALTRLYRRGSLPERPAAWLVSVALNLFRNASAKRSRRRELASAGCGGGDLAPPPSPSPEEAAAAGETRTRVRATLARLPERERSLLLLRAEGYPYRDLAEAVGVSEASVGTLLARARRAFSTAWEDPDA